MNVNDTNDLPVAVFHHGGNTFTIEWDESHEITSQFNTWTAADFQHAIRIGLNELHLEKKDTEFAVDEFEDNFDELFARVENGETLTIVHPDGKKVLMMPADELPDV